MRIVPLPSFTPAMAAAPRPAAARTSAPPAAVTDESPRAGGLGKDFARWLAASPWANYDFARADVPGGSFGGGAGPRGSLRRPVVFVHGNSDSALGRPGDSRWTGWRASVAHLLASGYRREDLYGTTWGAARPLGAGFVTHDRAAVMQTRAFLEAVLAYTGAEQIDVVSHSMGVTLARKAIKGGRAVDDDGTPYDVGPPLTERVRTFIGIAGANRGLSSAFSPAAFFLPTAGGRNGFFPGTWTPFGVVGRSRFLADLDAAAGFEGERRYSIWSRADELMPLSGLVWGEPTARLPAQTGEIVHARLGHFALKDETAAEQLALLTAP